jgi:hypothetical protein
MKHVAIRLDEAKYKQLKIVVAEKGTTIQKAVEKAIEQYIAETKQAASKPQPEDLMGLLADTNVMELMEQDRQEELERDSRWP